MAWRDLAGDLALAHTIALQDGEIITAPVHHPQHGEQDQRVTFAADELRVLCDLIGDAIAPDLEGARNSNGVVRPLQTARSASDGSDADDNRTALCAPPAERFTDLGMSVSLPAFIQ